MASSKPKLLKIVNPIIGILFLVQAGTGIFHGAISFEVFEKVHGSTGYLLTAGIATHIFLNWNWIKANFFKKA